MQKNPKDLNKHNHNAHQSDHFDGTYFFNPGIKVKKNLVQVWKMVRQKNTKTPWPTFVENQHQPQLANTLSPLQCSITYINHACHLIQVQDLNILTDPIFSKKAGPFSLIGPKRVRKPGLSLKELPKIDVVLVSHNHYDHMDLATLEKLNKKFQPLFIVPLKNHRYLKTQNIERVIELDWWENYEINQNQSIHLMPAQHWSQRRLTDANKALWGGFWIASGSLKIYFAGDSGYCAIFKEIRDRMGISDISILPIGSYEPRWFMKAQHMNPEEAVLASQDLESRLSIATHHQTFRLSHEGIDDPVNALRDSLQLHQIEPSRFIAPEVGETTFYEKK